MYEKVVTSIPLPGARIRRYHYVRDKLFTFCGLPMVNMKEGSSAQECAACGEVRRTLEAIDRCQTREQEPMTQRERELIQAVVNKLEIYYGPDTHIRRGIELTLEDIATEILRATDQLPTLRWPPNEVVERLAPSMGYGSSYSGLAFEQARKELRALFLGNDPVMKEVVKFGKRNSSSAQLFDVIRKHNLV